MARVWMSSFELNSRTAEMEFSTFGTGGVVQSTFTHGASRYAWNATTAPNDAFIRQPIYAADVSTVAYQRIWIRIESNPSATASILAFAAAANTARGDIALTTTGTLRLRQNAGTQIGSESAALTVGRWHCVELKNDPTSSPGTITARLDGVQFASGLNDATTVWAQVRCGHVTSITASYYLDDWALNDSAGSTNNSYPGMSSIVHCYPNGPGSANAWLNTASGAGSTTDWQLVDDVGTPDDATTMIRQTTLNVESYFSIYPNGVGPYDTINSVMIGVRFRNNTASATQAFTVQAKIGAGGSVSASSNIIPNSTTWRTNEINASSTLHKPPLNLELAPDGGAWTPEKLRDLQIGVKATVDSTTEIQVSTLWAYVDYTPALPLGTVNNKSLTAVRKASTW